MTKVDDTQAYDEWAAKLTLSEIKNLFSKLGVERVVIKRLADKQDNSKNQFYWSSDLTRFPLPLGDFASFKTSSGKRKGEVGYKAPLKLHWIGPDGSLNHAPKAQLIHYPQYPESRLSGLLADAKFAPRTLLGNRASARPRRVMLLGLLGDGVIGVVVPPESRAATEALALLGSRVFANWFLVAERATALTSNDLLREIAGVNSLGFVTGCSVTKDGVKANSSPNAAGLTLETLLGVRPNSKDEPDFLGWELKTHKGTAKVTLMTPAPTGGAVAEIPAPDFMREFGWLNQSKTRWDFNGSHRATQAPGGKATTRMVVTDDEVRLLHKTSGEVAMTWSIADLLTHWSRKHSLTAYVERRGSTVKGFTFGPHVQLGQGIKWDWFTQALGDGTIVVDPAYHLAEGKRHFTKARAQFRCHPYQLGSLYPDVTSHDVRHFAASRSYAEKQLAHEEIVIPEEFYLSVASE